MAAHGRRHPLGIDVGVGAAVIVVVSLLASRIPESDAGRRCAAVATAIGGFALLTVDPPAAALLVPGTWLVMNGFLVNHLGQLTWHGESDEYRFAALAVAGCVGVVVGGLGRALRDLRARLQLGAQVPFLVPARVPALRSEMKNQPNEETRQRA